jgi:hypothetical protein
VTAPSNDQHTSSIGDTHRWSAVTCSDSQWPPVVGSGWQWLAVVGSGRQCTSPQSVGPMPDRPRSLTSVSQFLDTSHEASLTPPMNKGWNKDAQGTLERNKPASSRRNTEPARDMMSHIRQSTYHERLMGSTGPRQAQQTLRVSRE